jgi:hypothetical protein
MDIKTIIHLMATGIIEPQQALTVIAKECEIDPEQLKAVFTSKPMAPVKKTPRYSQQEIDKVVEMWQAHATKGQIAKALGRDRISVNNLMSRLRKQGLDLPLRPLEHLKSNSNQLSLF